MLPNALRFRLTLLLLLSVAGAATEAVPDEPPSAGVPVAHNEAVELSASELQRYTGDFWEHDAGYAAEVRVIDGKLWAVHSPTRRNEMVPLGGHRFTMIGLPSEVYVDYTMDGERVVEVRRTINGEPQGTFRPFERREVTPAELVEYAGEYYSPALDVVYQVRVEEGRLTFQFEGSERMEAVAMFGDTFENADFGSLTFHRDAGGGITGFLLQSRQIGPAEFQRR